MSRNTNELRAYRLRKKAEKLLRKFGLIKFLAKYGSVEITGSYYFDLMTKADIDIYVVNPKMTKKKVVRALTQLIFANKYRGHLFYDFTIHKHVGFPKGWYVGLKTRTLGEKWKIDIWFIKRNSRPKIYITQQTQIQRRKILRLKTKRDLHNIDIPAWHIYQSVINGSRKNTEILKSHGLV